MDLRDEEGRDLEVITQWQVRGSVPIFSLLISQVKFFFFAPFLFSTQASYARLRPQMRCESLIASPRRDFSVLAMVTECWAPAAGVWVGDYPYLQVFVCVSLFFCVI